MFKPDFSQRILQDLYLGNAFEFTADCLIGAYLCSQVDGEFTAGMITEAEVYIGHSDKACHAYPDKLTPRTATMFRPGGCAYVFFIYGMYNQFNVVIGPEGVANAVLIRSLEPISGIEIMQRRRAKTALTDLTTGPGKLCQALGMNRKEHDGVDLSGDLVWLSPGVKTYPTETSKRVGIDYAEECRDYLWRYTLAGNKFISKI